jgi:hypothetical protein
VNHQRRKRPFEKLRGESRDREVETLDAQRGNAEQHTDQHRHDAAKQKHHDQVGLGQA